MQRENDGQADVDAAAFAFETDPSAEHETTLRETLRANGYSDEQADRIIAEIRAALP